MEPEDLFNDNLFKRVQLFERNLASGEQFFCDTDELEEIIEYYFEIEDMSKAWEAIHYGLRLYPYENFYQIKKAEVMLNRREVKQAIRLLDEARSREPNNSEISKLLGDCYNYSMQYKRAVDFYHMALKDSFEVDEVLLQLIRLHFIMDKPEKAVSYLTLFPEGAFMGEAIIPEVVKLLTDFGQTQKAIDFLRGIIDNEPYSYSAWYFLGYCFQRLEQFERAVDAFEYCIAIDDTNSMGHLGKGNSLAELRRYDDAILSYKEALDNDITDAEVYCNIAECYEQLDNLNTAKYYYLKALKTDNRLSDAFYGLALIYKKQERYREAERNFLKAIDLDHFEALFHIELAELYVLMDQKDRCLRHYAKAMEIDASTLEIVLDYAAAMVHFDETEHAVTLLKERIEQGLYDHRFLYRISSYLFQLGTYEAAYEYLHTALQENPEDYGLLYEFSPFVEHNSTVSQIIDMYLMR